MLKFICLKLSSRSHETDLLAIIDFSGVTAVCKKIDYDSSLGCSNAFNNNVRLDSNIYEVKTTCLIQGLLPFT